jgi:hypothetical protein
MSKWSLKQMAQEDWFSKEEQPSNKQARQQAQVQPPRPILPSMPQSLPRVRPSLNSPLDPKQFKRALDMLAVAWNDKFPTIKFPIEQVYILPMHKIPLARQCTTAQVKHNQKDGLCPAHSHALVQIEADCAMPSTTHDIRLSSGHVVYTTSP